MYSVIIDGKVEDFNYRKINDFTYVFRVGDKIVGQIFKMKSGWSAVSHQPCDLCLVDGFRTRYHASAFLLKCIDL